MTDAELDQKLKAAPGPSLDADYLEDFPRQVLAKLRSAPEVSRVAGRSWWPRLGWGAATIAGLVAAFAAGHGYGRQPSEQDVLASARLIQATMAMFPNRVRALVHDEHGVKLVLSDQADVPLSTPIYVRICDGDHCESLVTFSGQELQIAGQKITVLSDGDSGIILESRSFVWSSQNPGGARTDWRIEARNCQIASLKT